MTTDAGKQAPAAAAEVFGPKLAQACRYVDLLADAGVQRGLIGPREAGRLWDRHVLNCAVIAELIRPGVAVIDVGSGAGLPGVPLALARPDLAMTLLEPMARRVPFLHEVVDELGLQNVTVVRGRAEDTAVRRSLRGTAVVTARAVAGLDRLLGWCLPLMAPAGELLAIKGESAQAELDEARSALRVAGVARATVELCGVGVLVNPTTVIRVVSGPGGGRRRGIG
ncbi:MAG: 16S rRNA (guanine(527)-N(7))-methyltransferase RsmG [Geodermatophilaceae bacterium]